MFAKALYALFPVYVTGANGNPAPLGYFRVALRWLTVEAEQPDNHLLNIKVPKEVKTRLMNFLGRLVEDFHLDEKNSLLTDRTFLVKAVRILKAKAVLDGREQVIPKDLSVLKYMLTFRVPDEVYHNIEEILTELAEKKN